MPIVEDHVRACHLSISVACTAGLPISTHHPQINIFFESEDGTANRIEKSLAQMRKRAAVHAHLKNIMF
jgi:hypothetical protein